MTLFQKTFSSNFTLKKYSQIKKRGKRASSSKKQMSIENILQELRYTFSENQ